VSEIALHCKRKSLKNIFFWGEVERERELRKVRNFLVFTTWHRGGTYRI
jgi:hypothetical protein